MDQPRLTGVTRLFFRVGVTVFGGGDPTIAILQREFYKREWLSPEKFGIAFGLARLTPGTNMLAFCAAAGWYLRALPGALVGAALLLVRTQCSRGRWLRPIVIAAGAFVLAYVVKLSPLQVIGAAAIAGFFWVES